MSDPRGHYLRSLSENIRNLQRMYARSSKSRDFSPQSNKRRLELGEQIQNMILQVTPEEQREYHIW